MLSPVCYTWVRKAWSLKSQGFCLVRCIDASSANYMHGQEGPGVSVVGGPEGHTVARERVSAPCCRDEPWPHSGSPPWASCSHRDEQHDVTPVLQVGDGIEPDRCTVHGGHELRAK